MGRHCIAFDLEALAYRETDLDRLQKDRVPRDNREALLFRRFSSGPRCPQSKRDPAFGLRRHQRRKTGVPNFLSALPNRDSTTLRAGCNSEM